MRSYYIFDLVFVSNSLLLEECDKNFIYEQKGQYLYPYERCEAIAIG